MCGISSCTRVFTPGSTFDAFRSHCNQKHYNWQDNFIPSLEASRLEAALEAAIPCSTSSLTTGGTSESQGGSTCEISIHNDTNEVAQEEETLEETTDFNDAATHDQFSNAVLRGDITKAAAKFILTLKERFKLTQVSLDYTVKAVDELMQLFSKCEQQSVSENPELAGSSPYQSPFDELSTEYQQTKYFKENFGLIVSAYIETFNYIVTI